MTEKPYPLRTTHTSFEVIETIEEHGGVGVTELADLLNISKSAAHKHLTTLHRLGYLSRRGDEFDLGLGFFRLGMVTRRRTPLFEAAERVVDDLAVETGETVSVMTTDGDYGVYIYHSTGDRTETVDIEDGERVPLHSTASGKAILAYLPDETIDEVIWQFDRNQKTSHTRTDRDALEHELESIRQEGVAFEQDERVEGWQSVAAPVLRGDDPVGSIGLVAPAVAMTVDSREAFAALLREAADEVQDRLAEDRLRK